MSRRKFTSDFKTKVVLEALSERFTIQELGRKHNLHPSQISSWKAQFLSNASSVFDQPIKNAKTEAEAREETLLKVIGQLKVENDFLKTASS